MPSQVLTVASLPRFLRVTLLTASCCLLLIEIGFPTGEPEWCNGTTGNLMFSYCTEGSYQLCAVDNFDPGPGPVAYRLVPPYDNGSYGSVDPSTGLWTWSGATVQPGTYSILFQANDGMEDALFPFELHVQVTERCLCCEGRVGDVNANGGDEPTIGDVVDLVILFGIIDGGGTPAFVPCLEEADINQSGGISPTLANISIADISLLINYLFIAGPYATSLPACLEGGAR